eukprot:CAMPEP_0116010906 /NCGR_PEP_ID=MMETSP0321-20121206/4263_1 /TAXON_ID=163516 /ORGANISM="Leptocylindrus danicus var. danicus, Strain B650" /LENGTH=708 /DNA_ID=CAMNT_0003480061 /DNA_START=84 /DNA_END=2207 /DNA_ORIENTATION=+
MSGGGSTCYSWASCAMNSTETYLVTPCGDLLVSRCRTSTSTCNTYDADANDDEKGKQRSTADSSNHSSNILTLSRCSSYNSTNNDDHQQQQQQQQHQGLLGGDSSMEHTTTDNHNENQHNVVHDGASMHYNHQHHPRTGDMNIALITNQQNQSYEDDALKFMPSFDYSHNCHVHDHHEDVHVHASTQNNKATNSNSHSDVYYKKKQLTTPFLHGIPVFFSHLSQIKVTKLSAHPLGSHCLLISSEALLFSFGSSNEHGQLGTGTRRACASPTVITPILENGGKALDCAAGATHSLVIVQTDGKRVSKMLKRRNRVANADDNAAMSVFSRLSTSSNANDAPSSVGTATGMRSKFIESTQTPVCLHQVYAFGSNSHMKLGLVNTSVDESDDVLLPRRVALHCQVSQKPGQKPGVKYGIFSLAASMHHSAALVRRSNGSTELYTWGYAGDGALGLDARYAQVVVTPTLVRNLPPYLNTQSSHNVISKEATISTLLTSALSKSSSYSIGKRPTLSLGSRSGGMGSSHSEVLVDIAVGVRSTFLLTSEGKCLVFGKSDCGLLGLGEGTTQVMNATRIAFGESSVGREMPQMKSLGVGLHHAVAVSLTGEVWRWGSSEHGQLGPVVADTAATVNTGSGSCILWRPERLILEQDGDSMIEGGGTCDADLVCAGSDATVLVMKSGAVLSCGRNSGRLGQGELDENVYEPTPMFGGV